MNVFLSGFYVVAPKGSHGDVLYATWRGDLDSFNSAATQAVEISRRDNRMLCVWYHPFVTAGIDEGCAVVGYAKRGNWHWRSA